MNASTPQAWYSTSSLMRAGEVVILNSVGVATLCAGMLLGRLELFTILVLFMPMFWRG